jgi:hypothetical protein
MVYHNTVDLILQDTTLTYVTHRRFFLTATILDAKFGFRQGEYVYQKERELEGGLYRTSHFIKSVIDENDLERSIEWLESLGFVKESSCKLRPLDKKKS